MFHINHLFGLQTDLTTIFLLCKSMLATMRLCPMFSVFELFYKTGTAVVHACVRLDMASHQLHSRRLNLIGRQVLMEVHSRNSSRPLVSLLVSCVITSL